MNRHSVGLSGPPPMHVPSIAAGPGSKTYGILSVLIQAWYRVEYLFTVHEHVFNPPPKVKSAVIRMTRNDTQQLGCDEKLFKQVVKTTFNQRRKTLQNGISNAQDLSFSKEEIAAAIESLGLSPSVRGETLTLAQFAALSDVLGK